MQSNANVTLVFLFILFINYHYYCYYYYQLIGIINGSWKKFVVFYRQNVHIHFLYFIYFKYVPEVMLGLR